LTVSIQPFIIIADGQTDLLLEADLNHVQERQKVSGRGRRRCTRARHQPRAADTGLTRKAHRRGPLSRLREHAQPGVQGKATAKVEAGSDRPHDAEPEFDQASNLDERIEGDLWVRQGTVREDRLGRHSGNGEMEKWELEVEALSANDEIADTQSPMQLKDSVVS
jgi:hypothetical protein